MKYQTGTQGRVFLCRLEDGDDLLRELTTLAKTENIHAAVFHVVGGMKDATIVCGPETDEMPPRPIYRTLDESHEVTGTGTIFFCEGEPKIHFHGAFGKRDSVRMGCLREQGKTFIILEVVVIEIAGVKAGRQFDPVTGFNLLVLDDTTGTDSFSG